MSKRQYHRLLLTGAAGALGRILREQLKADCDVLRLSDMADLGAARPNEEIVQTNLVDAAAVLAMAEGVDAIIHLGGYSVEGPFQPILEGNIIGLWNVYEAARQQGVRRVIFASSNHVTGFYRQGETIDAKMPVRPDGFYGISKAFGENVARFYFDRYGIESACLRIGSCLAEPKDRRMLSSWLSFDDLYRLITSCLAAPVLDHTIVYGMSDNQTTWWDNRHARHIGFQPQDSADVFREAIVANTQPPDLSDPAVIHQGGVFVRTGPF